MKPFEDDLATMVSDLKKRSYESDFQSKVREIEMKIKSEEKIIIGSDKTGNFYTMPTDDYKRSLQNTITKEYRKVTLEQLDRVDMENAKLAETLDIAWRLEQTEKEMAFITVKDHKEDFSSKPSYRLINPMKNPIGRVSKVILQRINGEVRDGTGLNQWHSTKAALDWFNGLENKEGKTFFQFDIQSFYPSISLALLMKALTWAKDHSYISDKAVEIILAARKTFLFGGEDLWVKKANPHFDVSMGAGMGRRWQSWWGFFFCSDWWMRKSCSRGVR